MKLKNLLICSLIVAFILPFCFGQQQTLAASGTVEPPQGRPGAIFTFTATGFGLQEELGTWLVTPDGQNREIPNDQNVRLFADAQGQASWAWVAPDDVAGGTWQMVARGFSSGERVFIPFTIERQAPVQVPSSSSMVTPNHGLPGTSFTFVARGNFIPGEQVGSWLILPDGTKLDLSTGMSVDPNKQIFRIWDSPKDAPTGNWVFHARGIASGFTVDIPFQIDSPTVPVATPTPAPPSQTVSPDHGLPGTVFTFTAAGFTYRERIAVWVNLPDRSDRDVDIQLIADESGQVSWQWEAPPDSPVGNWRMIARGQWNHTLRIIPFIIGAISLTPTPTAVPQVWLVAKPDHGLPGTIFTFYAEGFGPEETVSFWATDPEGYPATQTNPTGNDIETKTDAAGKASWRWKSPVDGRLGRWIMTGRGKVSDLVLQAAFTLIATEEDQALNGVEPPAGRPGTTFKFFARGYDTDEIVRLWVFGPRGITFQGPSGDLYVDANGYVEWTWTAPQDMPEGAWNMVARGLDSNKQHVILFTIEYPPAAPTLTPTPAPYAVAPPSGPRGTTFSFFAEGFAKQETLGYWLTAPDTSVIPIEQQITANDQGRADWQWTAPQDAQRGLWQMTIRPARSDSVNLNIVYTIRFRIE